MSKRQKAFRQPIFIGYAKLNYEDLILHDIHCNGFGQIFFENLYPNQRFGVETVIPITVSTNHNHYNDCSMSKRQKAFRQPIFIGYAKLNYEDLILHDIHCNGFGQIFFENLYPNQRFGVETVIGITVSTNHNHYKNTKAGRTRYDVC